MEPIFTFYLPLKADVTPEQIHDSAQRWIEDSYWYQFTETRFPEGETDGTLVYSSEDRRSWFRHFEFKNEKHYYIGYRLESLDQQNRRWSSDAIFVLHTDSESSGDSESAKATPHQNALYAGLICGAEDRKAPADFSSYPGSFRYPRILRVVNEMELTKQLPGLQLGTVTVTGKDSLKNLKPYICGEQLTELPILYLYLPDNPEILPGLEEYMLPYFSRILYLYSATTAQQNKMWQEFILSLNLTSKDSENAFDNRNLTDNYHAEIYWPKTHIRKTIPFSLSFEAVKSGKADTFRTIQNKIMEQLFLMQAGLPLDRPTWNTIRYEQLYDQTHHVEEPFQISMNEQMANRMHAARRQHKYTQAQLAKMVGQNSLLISRLERLETIKTQRSLIHDIEKVLGLEYNEIARLENAAGRKDSENNGNRKDLEDNGLVNTSDYNTDEPNITGSGAAGKKLNFCYYCGAKLMTGSRYCQNCGKKLV